MIELRANDSLTREELFRAAASCMGLSAAIIEKDYWICWMLSYLFEESSFRNQLSFKGGTSLSKGW